MEVPWGYSTPAEFGKPARRNLPTNEGRELGRELARLATIARLHADKHLPLPCRDCAFQLGTDPNGAEETLMDAVKCIVEGETFYCHVDTGKPCAGWLALTRVKA